MQQSHVQLWLLSQQLNHLSLDHGLYLTDCRIQDEVYSLQFSFLFLGTSELSHRYKTSTGSIHSVGSSFYSFQSRRKYEQQDSRRYLQFLNMDILLPLQIRVYSVVQLQFFMSFPQWADAVICHHLVFLLIDCLLIIYSKFIKIVFVIKLILLSRFFAHLLLVHHVNNILLAWMLYLFNLFYLSMQVVIVSPTMKLTKNGEYSFSMYHKDSNNFFSPIKVKYI